MKSDNKIFTREQFTNVLSLITIPSNIDLDFLYEVYKTANESILLMHEQNNAVAINNINQTELIYYSLGELIYTMYGKSDEALSKLFKNEEILEQMATVTADKYLTLSQFGHFEQKITNKFLPPSSSLSIYLNFMQNILNSYEKNDPASTLISDLLTKSISISRCILMNLIEGYTTEAFSCWRTLHECECTLTILDRYGEVAITNYLKHMKFGIAFKDQIRDKNERDRIFYSMKDEMKALNLKSKDIKKYIEYGWLYAIPTVQNNPSFKLNFRDGLEKVAGLSACSEKYELSSEILHSTPLLIYSKTEYFYYVTLLSLYESFFRLEQVFVSLFSKRVDASQMKRYEAMRDVYYTQLRVIYLREQKNFEIFKKSEKIF